MNRIYVIILLSLIFLNAEAQKERSFNRKGVRNMEDASYNDAEVNFRKALEIDSTSVEANYNLAGTLYYQQKYDEASKILSGLIEKGGDKDDVADILHNIGNNLLKQEMYEQSIEAYKNSLKIRPTDDETRYNLAWAQTKLKEQQNQDQQNQDQQNQDEQNQDEQNQDEQNQDEQNQDEQNQDQQNQDQQNQDQQNQDEQNQDKQNQDQQNQDPQQGQQKPVELSKEDMERMLEAISQQEKEVQDKLEKQKAAAKKIKTEKDW